MAKQEAFPVLRRSFRLLKVLGQRSKGMTFNEISSLFTDAPASSVSRLLKALQDEQMIVKSDASRVYLLGDRATQLGRLLRGQMSYAELLRPVVDELAQVSGQSTVFFKMMDDHFELVVKHEVADGFHYIAPGFSNYNFTNHGAGLVMMAYQSPHDVQRLWKLKVQNHASKPSKQAYLQRIQEIREAGYCFNQVEDRNYVIRIMAPVFLNEQYIGAIGFSMFSVQEHDPDYFEQMILEVKEKAVQATHIISNF